MFEKLTFDLVDGYTPVADGRDLDSQTQCNGRQPAARHTSRAAQCRSMSNLISEIQMMALAAEFPSPGLAEAPSARVNPCLVKFVSSLR